jgi:hypothetical protein
MLNNKRFLLMPSWLSVDYLNFKGAGSNKGTRNQICGDNIGGTVPEDRGGWKGIQHQDWMPFSSFLRYNLSQFELSMINLRYDHFQMEGFATFSPSPVWSFQEEINWKVLGKFDVGWRGIISFIRWWDTHYRLIFNS